MVKGLWWYGGEYDGAKAMFLVRDEVVVVWVL